MDIFGAQLAEMRKQDEQKKQDDQRAAQKPQPSGKKSTGDPYSDQLAALRKEQATEQRPQPAQQQPKPQQVQQQPKSPVSPSAAPGAFGQQKQTQRSKRADEVLADVASGYLRNTPRPVTYKQSNTNPQMQEGVTVNPHRGINFAARDESTPTSNFYDRVSLAARGKTDALSDLIAREKENKRVETDPTVLNYRAAERRKREAENELNRLKDGVKLPDGTTVLKDGTVLKPGEQETKLAQAQKAVDISVQQSRNFFGNLTKEQQNVETNPLGVVLKTGTHKGLAQAGYTSSGIFDAVLGKHGIIGTLLESAGGMFGDGINNLLQKDLINSEYIRSGDWNPVTKMHTKNTATMQAVNQYAAKQAAGNKTVQQAIDVDAGVVQMLPLFFLQAYTGATGAGAATPGAAGTTQGLQYAANLNTASTTLQQSNIMFRHAASMMARDPASQFTFSQSFGNSYNEAKQDGADNPHAIVYALLNATINTAVEMGGGIETLPTEMQAAAAAGRSGLWQMADAVCDEMKEEVVQGFFERGLKAVYDQVEIASMTNPDAMINPNVMIQEAAMAAIGTVAQIPVQRGIGRVVGHAVAAADYRANANSRAAFDILDKARQVDEKNNNDEATIAALNEINSNSKLREGFRKIYKTDVGVVLHEFMQSVKEEQSAEEQTTTPAQETSQEAAGAPRAAQGAVIPESTTEAPTAAPVELNSQEREAEDVLQNPTETRTTLPPAEQAPSIAQGGQEAGERIPQSPEATAPFRQGGRETEQPVDGAQALADAAQRTPTEERAAEDVGPYEGEPGAEQPAEAPAPAQTAVKKTTATEATRKLQEKYTVGQGTPETGLAANEPAGVGEVRGPGSLAPDGEVNGGEGAAESGPEPGQKRSKTESHPLQNMAERLGGEQEELYYTPKSERESLANAINRVDADMGGEMQKLLDKEMWNGEDIDTALTIQGMLQLDGVRNGDFSAAQAWARAIQARGTESGRALQAFSKWTRSGVAAAAQSAELLLQAENLTEEDRTRISNDVYQFGRDYDSIEDGDLGRIRDLIKRQARYRNTWTFGKQGFERMLNEVEEFDWLKEYAMRQMMNMAADYTETADVGQKVKTWQVQAQLSRLGTFFRNIGGNGVFGIQDTLSQDFFGVALDAMLGKITGKRTLGLDKGWLSSEARKGARQGMVRSILEVAGDVDMGAGGSKYGQGANRTFKMSGNAFERLLSRWEQLLGYSLTTSDRSFRGGIEAEQQRGLSGFENLTEEERQALAQNMADYRLFQNHGVAYGVSKGMHDIANLIGFGGQRGQLGRQGGFGAGDLLIPYPGVPANLGVKALEYSPLNVAKGLTEMANLLSDAKTGGKIDVTQQQNAVMDIARGLHGTALLAGLAALFKAGLFKNADDEEDKDAKALANAEGRQGVQMNLSAILRYLQGGDAAWKDGDQLMKIDWLEPMNAFLAIASMAADESTLSGYASATFNGTLQSILDMPVMESISNIFDNYNYSKGETVGEKMKDVAVGFGADALTGMLPAPVSQTARAMDSYYRETIGEDAVDTARRRVMNAIPGLRQQLDPKLDNFGRPKEQAASAYNRWMNSFVRPGQISDYKLGDVEQALDEFAQRTGEAVYPDRKAPNSFSAGGEKIQLSGEEKQAYQETYGQAALQYYGEILLGDEYKDASDGEKQWLLDQAEAYAAYQAKKAIMEQRGETYSNNNWDKVDALEQRGGDPFGYLFAKQGMKTATDGKDYKAVDALLGDIDKMDKSTQEQLFADVNRLDDRVAAHKAGIDTVLWEAAYAQKKKLEEDKSTTAVQDVISMTQYLDSQKGLNRKQKDLLREQMGFYTTFRADAEKFDKLTGAGLSSDKAGKVWNAINSLKPLEGKAGVTQNQRIRAISSMGNLSEAEKWAALEFYASESAYKKAMDAKEKGWTFEQWVQSYTKGK